MGLLDWLTSDSSLFTGGTPIQPGPGGLMGDMDQMGSPTGQMMPLPTAAPAPTGPMPDVNGPGMDAPMANEGAPAPPALGQMPRFPMGGDPMADMPQGSGSVAPMAPPGLPMPRPPGADVALPPAAAPTGGGPMPPMPVGPGTAEAVQSYQKAGGTFQEPAQKAQAQTILGRALGLDGNMESQLRGTLGAGFEAAGNSSGKSPGQAFSSGVGAGIKGGKKADDDTTDKQNKYLQQAIAAKRAGDTASYNVNYLKYLKENASAKLKLEQEKAASGKAGSVVNSQEQLYLRAVGAVNQDAGIKASANTVREAQKQFGVDSKEAKAALEAHEKRIKEVRDTHLGQLGVDPKSIGSIENKAGFSDKNPVKDFPKDPAAAQKAFDALPEGAYFINPKDGKLLIKRSAGSTSAANPAQVPAAPGAPQAPLPPALATANAGDDDGL